MSVDVSVCIPSYNGAITIRRAVDVAIRQGAEVIVCDDGSTDGTAALAEAAGAVVIRHSENRGQVAALNTAVSQATRRYVLFHGDDDWVYDDALPAIVRRFEETGADFVYGGLRYHGLRADVYTPPTVFHPEDYWERYACGAGVVWRRALWEDGLRYREFPGGVVADWDWILQIISRGGRGAFAPVIVLNYVLSGGRDWARLQANASETLQALRQAWPQLRAEAI